MKFIVKKDDFVQAVNELSTILVPGTTYRAISFIMVKAIKNKGIILESTDYEINLRKVIEARVIEEGALGIPGKYLAQAIKDFEGEELEIEQIKAEKIKIISANKEINFLGLSEDEYPVFPTIEEGKNAFIIPADILKENIKKVSYAVSKDTSNTVLCGALWEINAEKKDMIMVTTDSRRLVYNKISNKFEKAPEEDLKLIIPDKLLNYLANNLPLEDVPVDIVVANDMSKIKIKFNDNEIVSKLIVGEYPNYAEIIPSSFDEMNKLLLKKTPLLKAIRFVSILAEKKSYNVNLKFEKDKLVVFSDLTDIGEAREEISLENPQIEPINFIFNINFLKDALTWFEDEGIVMFYTDKISPVTLTAPENKDYLTIMMPIRPTE